MGYGSMHPPSCVQYHVVSFASRPDHLLHWAVSDSACRKSERGETPRLHASDLGYQARDWLADCHGMLKQRPKAHSRISPLRHQASSLRAAAVCLSSLYLCCSPTDTTAALVLRHKTRPPPPPCQRDAHATLDAYLFHSPPDRAGANQSANVIATASAPTTTTCLWAAQASNCIAAARALRLYRIAV